MYGLLPLRDYLDANDALYYYNDMLVNSNAFPRDHNYYIFFIILRILF